MANFSGPYDFFKKQDLIMEEVRNHQFRFKEITDPDSGEYLHTLEHEVRSMYHPMYRRALVNRNSCQSMAGHARGHDALIPTRA